MSARVTRADMDQKVGPRMLSAKEAREITDKALSLEEGHMAGIIALVEAKIEKAARQGLNTVSIDSERKPLFGNIARVFDNYFQNLCYKVEVMDSQWDGFSANLSW